MNSLNQVSRRCFLNLTLLVFVAVLSGCQPAVDAARRSPDEDRSGAQPAPAAAADRPASAAQAEAGNRAESAEGSGSKAPSDSPASELAGSRAAATAGVKDAQIGSPKTPASADAGVKQDATKPGGETDEELLLLDDEPLTLGGEEDALPATAADNSRCHHCHLNFVDEELAVTHARAKIGCADCHGNCDAHIADESWASGGNGTPPGIMYPKEKINPFCLDCHPRDKLEGDQHEALLAGTSTEKYCTDCHGKHRLTERKCKWK